MYQYAEEKLRKELAKKQSIKDQKQKELKDITKKLESIISYNELETDQVINGLLTAFCMYVGVSLGGCSIACITIFNLLGVKLFAILLGLISAFFFTYSIKEINFIKENAKKRKELKQKGVKKFKKEKDKLIEKKLDLKKENTEIQNAIDVIDKVLEHIEFFKESANDLFYQADTKEEYEAKRKTKEEYEQLLDEFLKEKIDYSNIHLNNYSTDIDSKKLLNKRQ